MTDFPEYPMPSFNTSARARVGIQYMEKGDLIEDISPGWAFIGANGWVHFLNDDAVNWCSYPADVVYTIEWI